MEKELVEQLYREKGKNDSNSHSLAKSLNLLAESVFSDASRFIFELLQNADDAPPKTDSEQLQVNFRLFNNQLVFSHNGAHFRPSDVQNICEIGGDKSNKPLDLTKTGYKGIGFKSIFKASDCVHIVSDRFTFKFDKHHVLWRGDASFPWQVIPVWAPDLPEELNGAINPTHVNFIIQIKDLNTIEDALKEVLRDPRIILFLRNITAITYLNSRGEELVLRKRKEEGDHYAIEHNGKSSSNWFVRSFDLHIPDNVRHSLQRLSDTECPPKLKNARQTRLTYGMHAEGGELRPLSDSRLFNFLPTDARPPIPWLINADFLTDPQRRAVSGNDWNVFLYHSIARYHIQLLAELHTTRYRFCVLRMLAEEFSQENTRAKAFNNGLRAALRDVAFIPDISGDRLLKANEAIIDQLRYSETLPSNQITSLFPEYCQLAHPALKDLNKLTRSRGVYVFDETNLEKLFGSEIFIKRATTDGAFVAKLLEFLEKKIRQPEALSSLKFIPNNQNILAAPKTLYFPSKVSAEIQCFAELQFIHDSVFNYIAGASHVTQWLAKIGVHQPTDIDIFKHSIVAMIARDAISPTNTVDVMRFIFNLHTRQVLTDTDYKKLYGIKVLTINGMKRVAECFVSSEYDKKIDLDRKIPELNYISGEYCQESQDRAAWKEFFLKLRAGESLAPRTFKRVDIAELRQLLPDSEGYIRFIQGALPPGASDKNHFIDNLRYFPHLTQLKRWESARNAFANIFRLWSAYGLNADKPHYDSAGSKREVSSHLVYVSQQVASIPASDNNLHKSTEIFAPGLVEALDESFPVLDVPAKHVFESQINYLGLKKFIELDVCLELLRQLSARPLHKRTKDRIFRLYDEAVKSYDQNLRPNAPWQSMRLLTLSNTFHDAEGLAILDFDDIPIPVDSKEFLRLPASISSESRRTLAEILRIKLLRKSDLHLKFRATLKDNTLEMKASMVVPYLAVLVAHAESARYETIASQIESRLEEINFCPVDVISLRYTVSGEERPFRSPINAWYDGNKLYHLMTWSSPGNVSYVGIALATALEVPDYSDQLALYLQLSAADIRLSLKSMGYSLPDFLIANEKPRTDQETVGGIEADAQKEVEDAAEEATQKTRSQTPVEEIEGEPNDEPRVTQSIANAAQVTTSTGEGDTSDEMRQSKSGAVNTPFTPHITPQAAAEMTTNTELSAAASQSQARPVADKQTELMDEKVRPIVGHWGEEYMYHVFKRSGKYTEVVWLNEKIESSRPYDFEVIENGVKKYIEVKTTHSAQKTEFYMSRAEWKFMFEKKESYEICRVWKAGAEGCNYFLVSGPSVHIKLGFLMQDPITLDALHLPNSFDLKA